MKYTKPCFKELYLTQSLDCMNGSGASFESDCTAGPTYPGGCAVGGVDSCNCNDAASAPTVCSTGGGATNHTGCAVGNSPIG